MQKEQDNQILEDPKKEEINAAYQRSLLFTFKQQASVGRVYSVKRQKDV